MGSTARIKSDLDDVSALVEIFQVLKMVASNQFYSTAQKKEKFAEFANSFVGFFRMIKLSKATSPLVHNEVSNNLYVLITGEGGFMGHMTAKVIREGMNKVKSSKDDLLIVVGSKGVQKMGFYDRQFIPITDVENKGLYETTIEVKEHLIDLVSTGKAGKAFAIYPRAISLEVIKPYTVKLLPSDELVSEQDGLKDELERVIVESDPNDIIHYLADIWLTCRIYEMILDCQVAGFAAQSQQLEEGLDKLQGDQKQLASAFRKSQKGDIDASMREVFTAKTIISR